MSDDSETVEDTEKGLLAEATDDSCTLEFTDIVPLDRASDDYHKPEFIDQGLEIKPQDFWVVKQEPADEIGNADASYSVKQEPADEYNMDNIHEAPCFTIKVS